MKWNLFARLFLGTCVLVTHSAWAESNEPTPSSSYAMPLYTVTLSHIGDYAVVPGTVVPEQQAKLASRVMGYINTFDVQVGEYVERGSLLFSIDPTDVVSQTRQAEAALAQATAALKDAELDHKRFSKLFTEGSIPKQQFEKIKLKLKVAQENVSAAKAGVEQAKGQTQYTEVRSPFSGVVIQKMAVSGDLATPGVPVVVLENVDNLSIQVQIGTELYRQLALGTKAQVWIEGDESNQRQASIFRMVASANPLTRKHVVKLQLDEPSNMTSGQFARVKFLMGQREALQVPEQAIYNRAGVEGVFWVDEQNTTQFRMIRAGMNQNGMVEVQSGLLAGDRIVADNSIAVNNGTAVSGQ